MAEEVKGRDEPSRRRAERFDLKTPLDVTILRSGIPDTVPGRTVDASENGLAAMLAGELTPGETVGLQMQLPTMPGPLRTRAKVKYQDKLRCGLEFLWLSAEERAAIRSSAGTSKSGSAGSAKAAASSVEVDTEEAELGRQKRAREKRERRKEGKSGPTDRSVGGNDDPPDFGNLEQESAGKRTKWIVVCLVFVLIAAGAGIFWWRWQRGWQQIEAGLKSDPATTAERPEAQVDAEVMQKLLIHRVEPVYPPEARRANVQGVIALDIVIGRNGAVSSMHPLNGPDMLARAAMDALRWWRFEPYRINGEPAVVETTVAVEFKR